MYDETLTQEIPPRGTDRPYAAEVLNTPAVDGDDVYVRIPEIDAGTGRHGPCRYMLRNGVLPSEGDDALVTFDDENKLWIIGWWPYA